MNRLFLLIAALFLLTACSAKSTPASTPQQAPAASVTAFIPVAAYSAAPNLAETAAAANLAVTLAEQGRLDGIATETKAVWLVEQSNIAKTETRLPIDRATAIAQRETANAAEWLRITQEANRATMTYIAPINQATAAQLQADAKYADLNAWGFPVGWIFFSAAMLVLSLVIAAAFFYNRTYHPAITHTNNEKMPPIATGSNSSDNDTTPPGNLADFARLMEYGADGGLMGYKFILAIEPPIYRRGEYNAIFEWLKHKEKLRVEQGLDTLWASDEFSRRVLSVAGRHWAELWLQKYHNDTNSPAPSANMAENTAFTQHGHVNTGMFGGGEVVAGEITAPDGAEADSDL